MKWWIIFVKLKKFDRSCGAWSVANKGARDPAHQDVRRDKPTVLLYRRRRANLMTLPRCVPVGRSRSHGDLREGTSLRAKVDRHALVLSCVQWSSKNHASHYSSDAET